jgi:hypothetical protein
LYRDDTGSVGKLTQKKDSPRWRKTNIPVDLLKRLQGKPATMSNKDFQQHIRQLLAQQRNQDQQPAERKPPASENSKPPATVTAKTPTLTQKKPPATVTRAFTARRKSNEA